MEGVKEAGEGGVAADRAQDERGVDGLPEAGPFLLPGPFPRHDVPQGRQQPRAAANELVHDGSRQAILLGPEEL